eukprot:m.105364 g.105364  ORF g.105364 m.105364 type:complete len:240 (+) comp21012_c0_seq1:56-775(+)
MASGGGSLFRLWHCTYARSFRCLWTLTELGLDRQCELITMPFPPRVFHRKFLTANVLGTIPYFEDLSLVDASGKPRGMTESCAVPLYLVTKYTPDSTLGMAVDEPEYPSYLNWIAHADATLTFPQTLVLRYTLQEPGAADNVVQDYARWYLARLRMLNNTLADGRDFLVGNRFTIADICITYALYLGRTLEVDGKALSTSYKPQTTAYLEKMMARPGWKRAEGLQEASAQEFSSKHAKL